MLGQLKRLMLNILWLVVYAVSFVVAFIACMIFTVVSNFIDMVGMLLFGKVIYCKKKRQSHKMVLVSFILWFADYLAEKADWAEETE